ncbi:MAG: nicotinate phosphoribosyltransferase [Bifidobacteriaceae bacterium]|jgi:nicotinate phosphoribosyltransferase|nr:nicotinate phosphoribosyltransferase [Bifidobacteriaceae bacterium]
MVPGMSVGLLTDQYELTMLDAALADGTATRHAVFEVFARRLPAGRRYGVFAGSGRLLELLADFRFGQGDLEWLARAGIVRERTLEWLSNYRFGGTILGYAEGETYFPGSPVLSVAGTFAETVILETLILSVLNHDTAVASAASRMTAAAGDRPCLEMGARRTHEQAALAAARAAYVGGFAGTSVLGAGRAWGIPTIGTAAHAFTLIHDSEADAFRAQIAAQGTATTLLLDTYDVAAALRSAIEIAGTGLKSVRLDSGDLPVLAHEVRSALDRLGATGTSITVTSDLDEYAIAALGAAPVDSYGVGTRLVTGSGAPTAQMVYKLVAREDASGAIRPVAKAVGAKATLGGAKWAGRRIDDSGHATEEVIVTGIGPRPGSPETYGVRPLEVTYVAGGHVQPGWTGGEGLARAAERHRTSRAELPRVAWRLSDGEPAIPTTLTPALDSAGA